LELEGTLKITYFQPPCHGQGHIPLHRFTQSRIQPGLEHFQGGDSHNFSGLPVPLPHCPTISNTEKKLRVLDPLPIDSVVKTNSWRSIKEEGTMT